MSSRLSSRSSLKPTSSDTKKNTKQPFLAVVPLTPKMILPLLVFFTLTLTLNYYIKALYQKELRTHTTLSLEHSKWLQEEQILLTRLQKIRAYPNSHSLAYLEQQIDFQKKWKKIKLLDIPLVTIDEKTAVSEATEISQHVTLTDKYNTN